jgi:hypothetical protein
MPEPHLLSIARPIGHDRTPACNAGSAGQKPRPLLCAECRALSASAPEPALAGRVRGEYEVRRHRAVQTRFGVSTALPLQRQDGRGPCLSTRVSSNGERLRRRPERRPRRTQQQSGSSCLSHRRGGRNSGRRPMPSIVLSDVTPSRDGNSSEFSLLRGGAGLVRRRKDLVARNEPVAQLDHASNIH